MVFYHLCVYYSLNSELCARSDAMPDDLNVQVAVLAIQVKALAEASQAKTIAEATQVKLLADALREDRIAQEKFREEIRVSQHEVHVKLSTVQSSLDMAKGGWRVLTIIGVASMAVAAALTALLKLFYYHA